MTKQYFVRLADSIVAQKGTKREFSAEQVSSLADFCQRENPDFKRELWLDYIAGRCGPNGGRR
jgi:hypothetical protein